MSRIGQMIGSGGAAAAAFLLLVGSPDWNPSLGNPFAGDPGDGPTTSAPSDDPSEEPSEDPGDEPGADCDASISIAGRAVADYLYDQGFAKRDFIVGARVIDWSFGTGHEDDPFVSEPLTTEVAVNDFLGSGRPAAKAARRIADGSADDYVAVQFQNPISYSGNWYWTGDKAVKGGDRMVLSGDVWWMALDDCEVVPASSIRAICGNVGFDSLQLTNGRRD